MSNNNLYKQTNNSAITLLSSSKAHLNIKLANRSDKIKNNHLLTNFIAVSFECNLRKLDLALLRSMAVPMVCSLHYLQVALEDLVCDILHLIAATLAKVRFVRRTVDSVG